MQKINEIVLAGEFSYNFLQDLWLEKEGTANKGKQVLPP
jgi:hypothetical protein